MTPARRRLLVALGLGWVASLAIGFTILWRYNSTPGANAQAAALWPTDSGLERATDRPTLVLFAHPRCQCTRSSLTELRALLPRLPGAPRAYVAFLRPDGTDDAWADTDLWRTAAAIPGVIALADPDGRAARRFGATTSGTTLVYDEEGRLLFAGGLTSARGHEGESFGQQRILALLTHGEADQPRSPIFGCALDESRSASRAQPSEATP